MVKYPRLDGEGNLLGYKVRNVVSGSHYNSPGGIPLRDTVPFCAQSGSDDGALVICEGETDALALASSSFCPNCRIVACPGANAFANEWAGIYASRGEIYLIPDADEAGEKLVQKVCSLLPRAKVVRLPEGDLNDFLLGKGTAGLGELFDRAQPVQVRTPLRRTSYSFVGSADVDNSSLIPFVLRDTQLKRRGKELVGSCPFHEEKTPSFMVDEKKNLFYCHGCGAGGDVIAYVKRRYSVGYAQAIRVINGARS